MKRRRKKAFSDLIKDTRIKNEDGKTEFQHNTIEKENSKQFISESGNSTFNHRGSADAFIIEPTAFDHTTVRISYRYEGGRRRRRTREKYRETKEMEITSQQFIIHHKNRK